VGRQRTGKFQRPIGVHATRLSPVDVRGFYNIFKSHSVPNSRNVLDLCNALAFRSARQPLGDRRHGTNPNFATPLNGKGQANLPARNNHEHSPQV
jgi:hypothetical protein